MKYEEAMKRKRAFMDTARSHLGRPYRWGGDDPSGFDCSGLVVECMKACGLLKEHADLTADGILEMYRSLEQTTDRPFEGCLVFYLNQFAEATHIAICINDLLCITADGGGSKTLTEQDAIDQNAFIKIRPIDKRKSERVFVNPFIITGSE